ncbi:MAG: NADH-quinone oxidoreductase subunit NuoG [Gammaproteobacteria bacterium]
MVEFEINGKKLNVPQGTMVIEAADKAGIYIPRFCYHAKLSIAANCRMCLVEVEKSGKPLPACATPVTAGMRVFTQSPKALAAQRSVMEFLLINHPLDCPICDQGGECELQDLAMGYGDDVSRYTEGKRSIKDKNLGPLISSDMTRCIYCTRCVRFGDEIAGMPELGGTGRGEDTEIGTYVQHVVRSELSGNVIDLCPVGALTSKPFRFQARAWEMRQHANIAPHDCLGSNIFIHTRTQEYSPYRPILRVVPKQNEAINETWLSDRDRFSYEAIHSTQRLLNPRVRINGEWQETDWQTALHTVVERTNAICHENPEQIAALASPNSTVEEFYLLQKLLRALGSNNIDHRLRQLDFSDQAHSPHFPKLELTLEELETRDVILLIGSNVRHEQPLASHRIRQATLRGAEVMSINPANYDFNFVQSVNLVAGVENWVPILARILKALTALTKGSLPGELVKLLESVTPHETEQAIAATLQQHQKVAILLGAQALHHPQAAILQLLVRYIARLSLAACGVFTDGANSAGAWLAGAVPHRLIDGVPLQTPGLDAQAVWAQPRKAYWLLNIEPEFDCATPAQAKIALEKAEFVVCFTPFISSTQEEYADVLLPIAPFGENEGTFVNVEGRWQTFMAATIPQDQARPAWKVLRVLGNLFKLNGFEYLTQSEVLQEIHNLVQEIKLPPLAADHVPAALRPLPQGYRRVTEWPMYRVDNLVRRSQPLQAMIADDVRAVRIHSTLARRLQLDTGDWVTVRQGDSEITLPLAIDDRLADSAIFLAAGLDETAWFGMAFDAIDLQRSDHRA